MRNASNIIFSFLVILICLVANVNAQKLNLKKKMYETEISGYGLDYGKTYCIDFSRQQRVCKSAKSDSGEFEFLIQKNGETVQTIKSNVGSFTDKFWVYKGNLDKKNSDELVIVDYNGASNGLGVSYTTVYIFSDIKNGFNDLLRYPLEEFGERDNFIFDKSKSETLILATEWREYKNLDPKRGWGLYLVGRWFHLRNGKLKIAFDKPTLARRYTFGFEKERWETIGEYENNHRPYLWLKNPKTHKLYSEPKESAEKISTFTGKIEKYTEINLDDKYEREFTIRTNNNEKIICRFGLPYSGNEKEYQGKLSIKDFGLLPRNLAFPQSFSPLSIFDKLEGKKVKIESFQDEFNYKFIRLWFLE